jgi:carboxymethylenebutenolidase
MKRAILALACLSILPVPSALAAMHEQDVRFPSGSDEGMGFLVAPEGKGPFPAVVVIQEWWGLDGWVKDRARALAKEGYVALAVDLYRGKSTSKQEEAHQLMMGLPRDRALADLKGSVAYLQGRTDVRKERIGVIGWCMGGMYSLAIATEEPRLSAVVAYYGTPPSDAAAAKIEAPILGLYGADDKGPSPEQVKAFESTMKKQGKAIDVKIYDGAGHAFANENNPWGGYRPEAANDAWGRTVAFFAKHLKG